MNKFFDVPPYLLRQRALWIHKETAPQTWNWPQFYKRSWMTTETDSAAGESVFIKLNHIWVVTRIGKNVIFVVAVGHMEGGDKTIRVQTCLNFPCTRARVRVTPINFHCVVFELETVTNARQRCLFFFFFFFSCGMLIIRSPDSLNFSRTRTEHSFLARGLHRYKSNGDACRTF